MPEHSGLCSTRQGSEKCNCGALRPALPQVMAQMSEGSYRPAQPLGWQGSGLDFEVQSQRWDREQRRMVKQRPIEWHAYDEDVLVAKGTARTMLGLAFAIRRVKRRYARGSA
jgi:hypothetical protein